MNFRKQDEEAIESAAGLERKYMIDLMVSCTTNKRALDSSSIVELREHVKDFLVSAYYLKGVIEEHKGG